MDHDQVDNVPAGRFYRVHLCIGPNCTYRGSRDLVAVLRAALVSAGIEDRVEVLEATCRNRCDYGPSMNVYPGPVFYKHLTAEAIEEIVREHLARGRPAERWIYHPDTATSIQAALDRITF